jgi:hypothetical protein
MRITTTSPIHLRSDNDTHLQQYTDTQKYKSNSPVKKETVKSTNVLRYTFHKKNERKQNR